MALNFSPLGSIIGVLIAQLVALMFAAQTARADPPLHIFAADNPTIATQSTIDPAWEPLESLPIGMFWARVEIEVSGDLVRAENASVEIRFPGAHQLFWDGVFVGSSGKPTSKLTDEIAGTRYTRYNLRPEDLTPGHHIIALRASNWRLKTQSQTFVSIQLVRDDTANRQFIKSSVTVGAVSAVGLLITVFFIFSAGQSGIGVHRYILAGIAFAASAIVVLANVQELTNTPYYWASTIDAILMALAIFVFMSLPFIAIRLLKLENILLWMTGSIACLAIAFLPITWLGPDHDNRAFLLLGLYCLGLALFAKKMGSLDWLKVAIASCAAIVAIVIEPDSLHPFLFFLVCMASLQAAADYKLTKTIAVELEAESKRLELELIKKTIQPHFILNTLAATQELVETSPRKASNFIEALATEFRTLLSLSNQKMVLLEEEIELCRSYLDVMQHRFEAKYDLVVEGNPANIKVPPGILHTLLENAMSHGGFPSTEVKFELSVKDHNNLLRIQLFAPPSPNSANSHMSSGSGTKYIEARLREAFGDNWSYETEFVNGFWQSTIEIR